MPRPPRTPREILPLLGVIGMTAALSLDCGSSNPECYVGADCASGACSAAGQCVTLVSPDGGAVSPGPDGSVAAPGDSSAPREGAAPEDSAPPPASYSDAPDVTGCIPNDDGTITQGEVPMAAGLRARYLVSDGASAGSLTWDTTGTLGGDAGTSRVWDLTLALPADQVVVFQAESPAGLWWASTYPSATFALQLVASANLQGVFQAGSQALLLTGVVSPTSTAPSTELTYATSIPTLQFPLTMGATWNATSNVTGIYEGLAVDETEQYTSTVDAAGILKTPYATFPVLRVSTVLTRTVELDVTVIRSFSFVAECFGSVASVSSQSNPATTKSNEQTTEFSDDAEVRRLSP